MVKTITFQRALKHLCDEKTVRTYKKACKTKFQLLDSLSGPPGWCDATNDIEWLELTNTYVNNAEAKYLYQNQFNIDPREFEKNYSVRIDPQSIPQLNKESELRKFPVDTSKSIETAARKKLNKKYPYERNSYLEKGTLIIAITDVSFGGFNKDIEILDSSLRSLTKKIEPLFESSCFCKILIFDFFNSFYQKPEDCFFELISRFHHIK